MSAEMHVADFHSTLFDIPKLVMIPCPSKENANELWDNHELRFPARRIDKPELV
jgi:hypothetical protein